MSGKEIEEHYEYLRYINVIIGSLSLIACLISILTFIIFKKVRSFVIELVFYLTISSFFQTISFLIYFPKKGSKSSNPICQIQAFSMEFFGLAQFFWTCLLSFTIFQSVINLRAYSLRENSDLKKTRLIYILIAFGIPLLISFFGFIFNLYGKAGFWCFINTELLKENGDNKFQIFYIFTFITLWLCIIFNLILYSKVIKYIKNSFDEEDSSQANNYTRPLMMYSIIQVICLLPTTINRIYQIFNYSNLDGLDYIQSICDVGQGLLYSIAFGFNPTIRKAISDSFRSKFKKNEEDLEKRNSLKSENSMKSNLDLTGISISDIRGSDELRNSDDF